MCKIVSVDLTIAIHVFNATRTWSPEAENSYNIYSIDLPITTNVGRTDGLWLWDSSTVLRISDNEAADALPFLNG